MPHWHKAEGAGDSSSLMEETRPGREIKALGVGRERRGTRNENWAGIGVWEGELKGNISESFCGRMRFGFPWSWQTH